MLLFELVTDVAELLEFEPFPLLIIDGPCELFIAALLLVFPDDAGLFADKLLLPVVIPELLFTALPVLIAVLPVFPFEDTPVAGDEFVVPDEGVVDGLGLL